MWTVRIKESQLKRTCPWVWWRGEGTGRYCACYAGPVAQITEEQLENLRATKTALNALFQRVQKVRDELEETLVLPPPHALPTAVATPTPFACAEMDARPLPSWPAQPTNLGRRHLALDALNTVWPLQPTRLPRPCPRTADHAMAACLYCCVAVATRSAPGAMYLCCRPCHGSMPRLPPNAKRGPGASGATAVCGQICL